MAPRVGKDLCIVQFGNLPGVDTLRQFDYPVDITGINGMDVPFEIACPDGLSTQRKLDALVGDEAGIDHGIPEACRRVDRCTENLVVTFRPVDGKVKTDPSCQEPAFETEFITPGHFRLDVG